MCLGHSVHVNKNKEKLARLKLELTNGVDVKLISQLILHFDSYILTYMSMHKYLKLFKMKILWMLMSTLEMVRIIDQILESII